MLKLIKQSSIAFLIFVAMWYALSQLNWPKILSVSDKIDIGEQRLGEELWKAYKQDKDIISTARLDSIIEQIIITAEASNKLDLGEYKINIILDSEINAFALPNKYIILNTGLINECKNERELIGVLFHEIAHTEAGHLKKKLLKNIGLSVLMNISGGTGGPMVAHEIAELLSSLAFDRSMEEEADELATKYMLNCGIDPTDFANFLARINSADENNILKGLNWLSTHPDSEERAIEILKNISGDAIKNKSILQDSDWIYLKELNKLSNN